MMMYQEFHDAGYKIFGLNGVEYAADGKTIICECGNPDCKALFKHPRLSNWQKITGWSDEQVKNYTEMGHFKTGYGVLMDGLFVIDVDVRNGGADSFAKICDDLNIDLSEESGFVVLTGSGDGSMHVYFKAPEPPLALLQNLPQYEGIDFKSSGFVVGAGSSHASGGTYEVMHGDIALIDFPPDSLISLLKRNNHVRANVEGETIDISNDELRRMVMTIPNNTRDYERWIRIGMAIHHTTSGAAYDLWVDWSAQNDAHDESEMWKKWESFGRSASVATLGTLFHLARTEGNYTPPVTFEVDSSIALDHHIEEGNPLDVSHIDIRRPPGFLGELTQWINDQCLYPRENLAVAAALFVVSAVAGMRYKDDIDGFKPNMIAFCVAGSGTGKEAINKAINTLLHPTGVMPAIHGRFKSEQEVLRNLVRHQAALYTVDELGIELKKVKNAIKRGGASYLEGLFGMLMSVYSKADGVLPISGDFKAEIKDALNKELAKVMKKEDQEGETHKSNTHKLAIIDQINMTDHGIVNPYLSIFGVTTPVTFDDIVDHEMATNGFIARSIIFRDKETNPRRKEGFKRAPLPESYKMLLTNLYNGGHYDADAAYERVEMKGREESVETDDEACALLDKVYEYFYELAETHKSETGLEAIPRRGYEIASKISLICAIPEKRRTKEHVLYGFAVALHDINEKIRLTYSNENKNDAENAGNALMLKILGYFDDDKPLTLGVIYNRLNKQATREQCEAMLTHMVENGQLKHEQKKARNNKVTDYYTRIK